MKVLDKARKVGERITAMKIDTAQICDLTGTRGAALMRLCDAFGVGETRRGQPRQLAPGEAMTLLLTVMLMRWGLRRDEAIAMAGDVTLADWSAIVAEERRCWLFARRDPTGQAQWVTTIVGSADALELLNGPDPGYVVVDLYAIARRVMEKTIERLDEGAGHA
jgi:hypothetical protein